MNDMAELLHYATIALTISVPAIGVGIGEGLTGIAATEAINRQPKAQSDILKLSVLCMALIETAAIMGAAISMMLLFDRSHQSTLYASIAQMGIVLAICIP